MQGKKKKVLQSFYEHKWQFHYLIEMNTNLGNFNAYIHTHLHPPQIKKMDTSHTPSRHFLSLTYSQKVTLCLNHQSVTNVTSCSFTGPNDFHNLEQKIIFTQDDERKLGWLIFKVSVIWFVTGYTSMMQTLKTEKIFWHSFRFPKI